MPSAFTIVGWREWLALPHLGIDLLPVKVDTGARTSALHATDIELFQHDGEPWLRFVVHLKQPNNKIYRCQAPAVDQRVVASSSGQRQERWTILTDIVLGRLHWRSEITLTDRATMRYPMLLGRSAMARRLQVDPERSYLCGKPHLERFKATPAPSHLTERPS